MKKFTQQNIHHHSLIVIIVGLASIPLLCLIGSNSYALDFSIFGGSNIEEQVFKAIQRDESLSPNHTYESSISNLANKKQCLHVNHGLDKGERQKSYSSLAWVIDVPVDDNFAKKKTSDIKVLNAFVSAELLSKKRILSEDVNNHEFDRYQLTVKGWAAEIGRTKKSCFYLGKLNHLSVKSINEIEVGFGKQKRKVYEVIIHVGLKDPQSFPDWTDNQDIREAVPLINKMINGYERKV